MAKYLAQRIKEGKLDYDEVIAKYPELKAEIDWYLEHDDPLTSTRE